MTLHWHSKFLYVKDDKTSIRHSTRTRQLNERNWETNYNEVRLVIGVIQR